MSPPFFVFFAFFAPPAPEIVPRAERSLNVTAVMRVDIFPVPFPRFSLITLRGKTVYSGR